MKTNNKPDFRIDHTMLRVRDLDATLNFYVNILGMRVLRQNEYPEGKFTNTFIGYEEENDGPSIELTYNWEQAEPYDRGDGWGHIALQVADVYAAADYLKQHGVEFTKEPSPMKNGTRIIAFIKDPDGYPIELNEPV